jgi:hypothetical protein
MSDAQERVLQEIRHRIRNNKGVATFLESGPCFLLLTGQAYKGGLKRGVFLQITCDDPSTCHPVKMGASAGRAPLFSYASVNFRVAILLTSTSG